MKSFSVGDKVRCVKDFPGYTVGNFYTVSKGYYGNPDELSVTDDRGEVRPLFHRDFELVEKEEEVMKEEFKVGMRVKNISSGYIQEDGPYENCPVTEGTVTDVVEGGLTVNWDGIGRPLFCFEREVRHILDPMPVVETEDHLEDESGYNSEDTDEDLEDTKIKSDGGSSAYYDFPEDWVTLNDLMDYKAKNQWGPLSFHMGNITKATYRFGEKDGTSKEYDVNKIIYSGLRAKLMLEDKQSVREYLEELLNDPQFN